MSISDRSYMGSYGGGFKWSLTLWIIAANAVCFFLQSLIGDWTIKSAAPLASPTAPSETYVFREYIYLSVEGIMRGYVWQLITFQFMHGDFMHLLFNSLAIFFIGRAVERQLAPEKFLFLYLFSGVVGGLLQIIWMLVLGQGGAVVGASAGLFGLLGAFGLLLGHEIITVLLFFILPVSFPGRILIPVGIVISILGMVGDRGSGVAHAAHLGGILGSLAYLKFIYNEYKEFAIGSFLKNNSSGKIIKVANFKKKKPRTIDVNPVSSSKARPKSDMPGDDEINKILDKINEKGIHAITPEERKKLEKAGSKFNKS